MNDESSTFDIQGQKWGKDFDQVANISYMCRCRHNRREDTCTFFFYPQLIVVDYLTWKELNFLVMVFFFFIYLFFFLGLYGSNIIKRNNGIRLFFFKSEF